ncbi:RelA/SpoT AH/RIS domain-containing protein [Escherichia coli]
MSLKEAEKHLLPHYNFNDVDELLAAIGGGDIRLNQMVNFLQSQINKPSAEAGRRRAEATSAKSYTPQNRNKDNGRVVVEGVGNLMHHIAGCCQPIPGDEIVGFITQGRGITLHRPIANNWRNCAPMRQNALLTRNGVRATPPDIRWWSAWWLMIVVGCYVISRPSRQPEGERAWHCQP